MGSPCGGLKGTLPLCSLVPLCDLLFIPMFSIFLCHPIRSGCRCDEHAADMFTAGTCVFFFVVVVCVCVFASRLFSDALDIKGPCSGFHQGAVLVLLVAHLERN